MATSLLIPVLVTVGGPQSASPTAKEVVMRVKKIEIRRTRKRTQIISYGLGERGQTPVIAVVDVPDGDFRRKMRDPAVQARLGLKPAQSE